MTGKALALLSGWFLGIRFVASGRITTERLGPARWAAMALGLLVAATAWLLLVPMIHLLFLEFRARRAHLG